jgi:hypothetical protein
MSHPLEGRVRTGAVDAIVIDGLEGAALHDRIEFEGGGQGLVTALFRDGVEAVPLDSSPVPERSSARVAGPLAIAAADDLIGRTLDALGRPLDGGAPLEPRILQPVFVPPAPWGREPIRRRWTTGLLVYDLKQVLPMGGAILARGQIPFLLKHLLRHQAAEGRMCIYARPGFSGSSGRTFRQLLEVEDRRLTPLPGPLPPCIFIESGRDPTPASQWLVPWTAMAIGVALSERGRDMVVILDSLEGWKPHVERFPNEGAWLSQVGRLASLCRPGPRGSVTLVAAATVPTAHEIEGFFDGELDGERARQGLPVLDGTKTVRPPLKTDLRSLGRAVTGLAELEEMESRHPRIAGAENARFRDALRLRAALRFRPTLSPDSAEQLLTFLALCDLSDLPLLSVEDFASAFEKRLRQEHGPKLAAIRRDRAYGEKDRTEFGELAREIARSLGR